MPEPNDHKREWTLWRAIYSAFIALLPSFITLIGVSLWLVRSIDRNATDILYLKEADVRMEATIAQVRGEVAFARGEIIQRLDALSSRVEELQKQAARIK